MIDRVFMINCVRFNES